MLGLWQEDTTAVAVMKGTCMLIIISLSPLQQGLGPFWQSLVWPRLLNVRLRADLEVRFFFLCSLGLENATGSFFFKGTLLRKQNFPDKLQNVCYRINFMQGFDYLLIVLTEIRLLINASWIFLISNARLRGASKACLLVVLRGDVIWSELPGYFS